MHGGVTGMVQAIKVDPEHGTDIVYIMTDLEQTEITVRRDQVGTTHAHPLTRIWPPVNQRRARFRT